MCEFVINPNRRPSPVWDDEVCSSFRNDDIASFHASIPGYRPTPLVSLPALAAELGVATIWVKDESQRFDLSAFKVLGASYAIYRYLRQAWQAETGTLLRPQDIWTETFRNRFARRYTFSTATDGNHGRAVAWTARRLHQKAVIYMPRATAAARIENVRKEEAEVIMVDGSYDDAVRRAAADAVSRGWQVIADTGYPGYMTIPGDIMAGYLTLFREMESSLHLSDNRGVDLVFLQSGVGSLAAAAAWYYVQRYGLRRPRLISVEPTAAAGLLESARLGALRTATGNAETIMAGLNCGTPSAAAWPLIRDGIDLFLAINDRFAIEAMRTCYYPTGTDPRLISGESGSAGLAAFLALRADDRLRPAAEWLSLGPQTRILLINTEGATDPAYFDRVVGG